MVRSTVSREARVMTTPRVWASAVWQRLVSAWTESPGCWRRASTAIAATRLASGPWPRPSTTASRRPRSCGCTKCRSPETVCPGVAFCATAQSAKWGVFVIGVILEPFAHCDFRAFADFGSDFKIIHQPFRTRQADAETTAGGVTVLHGLADVRDARTLVLGDDLQAPVVTMLHLGKEDLAALGMIEDVAGDLRDGSGHQRNLRPGEAQGQRLLAPLLAGGDDAAGRPPLHPNPVVIWRALPGSLPLRSGTPP